jgi:hypothetical protein
MPGEKIYTQADLIAFVRTAIINEEDNFSSNRTNVNNALNTYKDGHNCERVFNSFINKEKK